MKTSNRQWLVPFGVFVFVFVVHALYIRHTARLPVQGWADVGIVDDGYLGFRPYMQAQDYFTGFSFALGAAFAIWAVWQFIRQRKAAMAAGAIGSISFVAILMAGGCFLLGCCGSPMLGVYFSLFGAKVLGAGKALMALLTLLSTGCGYFCLSPRFAKGSSRVAGADCLAGNACSCGEPDGQSVTSPK